MPQRAPLHCHEPAQVVTLEIETDAAETFPAAAAPIAPPQVDEPQCQQRVLLLEDRDDFREVLRDHLTSRGFAVTSVPSGVEGLREVKDKPFDLIICDMMMPRGGGEMFYWAVTRLRPATARRFIFFTGHKNHPSIEFFFRRVSATVLIKPFELCELDAIANGVLRRLI